MPTTAQTAQAFLEGRSAKCHNAKTDGRVYQLHGHPLATRTDDGGLILNWCGWYTPTTANHLNRILTRYNGTRVSYAQARENGQTQFMALPK